MNENKLTMTDEEQKAASEATLSAALKATPDNENLVNVLAVLLDVTLAVAHKLGWSTTTLAEALLKRQAAS